MDLSKQYDMLIEAIIRPPRVEYEEDDLGAPNLQLGNRHFEREDFELVNPRGQRFFCSMYRPTVRPAKLPCIVYCHGNAGCRLDACETLRTLLPMNIMVVTFDFSACGMSEGEYISLGYYEKDDVKILVDHLRTNDLVTRIGLWGRSMGAATSIQCAQADPSLACVVLDSPFSSLVTLAGELVTNADFSIPNIMFKIAFGVIRKSVKKRAKFDIKKLDNIKAAQEAFVPALFGHGDEDDFIRPTHTIALQEAYAGDSNKVIFGGDHNSPRPPFFHSSVSIFIRNHLLVAADFEAPNVLPNGATVDEFFASIGGGDTMNVFPRIAGRRRGEDDDSYSSDELDYIPPTNVLGGSARNNGAVTEDDLIQQAIALSLAEHAGPAAEVDPDLALALAMSAAEATKDASPVNGTKSSRSDLGDSNSSIGKADSRKSGTRSPAADEAPVAAPGSSKVKKDKSKDKDKKSKKDKDKKPKGDAAQSVSPSASNNPFFIPVEDLDAPVVSPRPVTAKDKDKKSKHKTSTSTSSPPLSPSSSKKTPASSASSPPVSPLAKSKPSRSDEPAVSLDFSDDEDDSMDEDMRLAIALSQQPQAPPRSKKK